MDMDNQSSLVLYPGRVTQVLDLHNFWMQIGSDESLADFETLQTGIQEFCRKHWSSVQDLDKLNTEQFVLVKTEEAAFKFRRGVVARLSSNSADVFLLDYGCTRQVNKGTICAAFPKSFEEYSSPAFRCCLAGIKPIGKSFTTRGIKTFCQMTEGKLFHSLIQYMDAGCYVVSLYNSMSTGWRSLTYQLLDEDVGLPYEDNIAPEYEAGVAAFAASFSAYSESEAPGDYDYHCGKLDNVQVDVPMPTAEYSQTSPVKSVQPNLQKSPRTPETPKNFQDFYPFDNEPTQCATSPVKDNSPKQNLMVRTPPGFQNKLSESVSNRNVNQSASPSSQSPGDTSLLGKISPKGVTAQQNLNFSNSTANTNGQYLTSVDLMLPDFFTCGTSSTPTQPQYAGTAGVGANLTPPTFYTQGVTEKRQPQSPQGKTNMSSRHMSPRQSYSPHQSVSVPHQSSPMTGTSPKSPTKHKPSPPKISPHQYGNYAPHLTLPNAQSPKSGYTDDQAYSSSPEGLSPNSRNFPSNKIASGRHATGSEGLKLRISHTTPAKSPHFESSYYHTGSKKTPISPQSPIDAFDLNMLDHTQHVSSHALTAKVQQERKMALLEETEELTTEGTEEMAKLGLQTEVGQDYAAHTSPAIFDHIADEIRTTFKDLGSEEKSSERFAMNKQSPNRSWTTDRHSKVSQLPDKYIPDVNFVEAVKEVLSSADTDGIDNTRALLNAIVESMATVDVDVQLRDVVQILLGTAIEKYSQYHALIIDTVRQMADFGMNIKQCMGKVLKIHQEKFVRVPPMKANLHFDCARVIAHMYNISTYWLDSNAAIQDGILMTVEKWIVFNCKGAQSGQDEKENVFLDCFEAFWDVAEHEIHRHDLGFCKRIREDICTKVLHERVSRCIRERLLEILLSRFSSLKSSKEETTQTFPEEEEKKPAMCEQGTMTEESHIYKDNEYAEEIGQYDMPRNPEVSYDARRTHRMYGSSDEEFKSDHCSSENSRYRRSITIGSPSKYQHTTDSQLSADITPNSDKSYYDSPKKFLTSDIQREEQAYRVDAEDMSEQSFSQNATRSRTSSPQKATPLGSPSKYEKKVEPKSVVDWFDYDPEPKKEPVPSSDQGKGKKSKKNKKESKKNANPLNIKTIAESLLPKMDTEVVEDKDTEVVEDKDTEVVEDKDTEVVEDKDTELEPEQSKQAKKKIEESSAKPKYVESSGKRGVGGGGRKKTEWKKGQKIDWWTMGDKDLGREVKPQNSGQNQDFKDEHWIKPAGSEGREETEGNNLEFGVDEDQFQFELDNDNEWETDSDNDDGINVIIDSGEITIPAQHAAADKQSDRTEGYDQKFPKSGLADLVPDSQPSKPRWVPGVRKCTGCGDTDHQVYNCPKTVNNTLLFF